MKQNNDHPLARAKALAPYIVECADSIDAERELPPELVERLN